MVRTQIAGRGVGDRRLLDAMQEIPREAFLTPDMADRAYEDRALPIALGQTISQPYIVAAMTEVLRVSSDHRVLEIGTGTGYQTAVLARLAKWIYTIERFERLSTGAKGRLGQLGYSNVTYYVGDGTLGWPDQAPYDRIIVTAAAPSIIPVFLEQLVEGGRLVIPIGEPGTQRLTVVERHRGKTIERPGIAVRFVKLIGEAGFTS